MRGGVPRPAPWSCLANDDATGLGVALDDAAGPRATLGRGRAGVAGLITGAEEAGLVVRGHGDTAGALHSRHRAALVAGGATVGEPASGQLGNTGGSGIVMGRSDRHGTHLPRDAS